MNSTPHVSHVAFCVFALLYMKSVRKLTFIVKESLILSSVCVIIVTRPPIVRPRLDEVQEQQTHIARTIYTCVILSSGCVYIVARTVGESHRFEPKCF